MNNANNYDGQQSIIIHETKYQYHYTHTLVSKRQSERQRLRDSVLNFRIVKPAISRHISAAALTAAKEAHYTARWSRSIAHAQNTERSMSGSQLLGSMTGWVSYSGRLNSAKSPTAPPPELTQPNQPRGLRGSSQRRPRLKPAAIVNWPRAAISGQPETAESLSWD